jgi:hypothetical protein
MASMARLASKIVRIVVGSHLACPLLNDNVGGLDVAM